jgi:hypothetical protein
MLLNDIVVSDNRVKTATEIWTSNKLWTLSKRYGPKINFG